MSSTHLVTLLLALGVALAGCTDSQPTSISSGGSLTRAMATEPASLDPQGPANSGLSLVLPYIYDTLVTRQVDGSYTGHLAEGWTVSPDGKTIDMKLRNGVRFHDGSPLNAAAVAFTFERFKVAGDKSPIAGNVKDISQVEAIDDLNIRFSLSKPNATFFSTIAMPYASILSPSAVKAAGEDVGSKPVGTGPFKLGEWKRGTSITLLRNPEYRWGPAEAQNKGPVAVDSLVFKVIPDANTQATALQSGDVDVIFVNEPSQIGRLEKDTSLRVARVNQDSLVYLGFNCFRAPFDDARVRQALSHAVNKEEILTTALSGMGIVATTPLPPTLLGYNPDLKRYEQGFDLNRARALLIEAGFAQGSDGSWQRDGKKLSGRLLTSTRSPNESIATVLQSQFKTLGVPVEIQQLDSATVMKATNDGAFDLLLWRYDWSDPDALNIYLSSSRIRQTNRVFYGNSRADALFEQGLREMDMEKRSLIYQEVQRIVLNDAPWQPLYHPVEAMVSRDRVKGLKIGSLARMLVNDVTLDEN